MPDLYKQLGLQIKKSEAGNDTVFSSITGKDYGTNQELATDLGIRPDQIDWNRISTPIGNVGQDGKDIEDLDGDLGGDLGGDGIDTEDSYQDAVLKMMESFIGQTQDQQPIGEFETEKSEGLGIGAQKDVVGGFQKEILDVEGLLDKLEGDIFADVKGKKITEGQRRRILASEQKPLVDQLSDLQRASTRAGIGLKSSQDELAGLVEGEEERREGIKESTLGLLPFYKDLLAETQDEEDKRKLENLIKQEEAKSAIRIREKAATVTPPVPVDTSDEDKKVIDKFRSSAIAYDKQIRGDKSKGIKSKSREQIIRELKAQYPNIDPRDIEALIYYELYPDEYINQFNQ